MVLWWGGSARKSDTGRQSLGLAMASSRQPAGDRRVLLPVATSQG
ncbi:hypothetical protein DAI22_03g350750 [Oryza sativa Japonica Group]|nr:hypothetical protein DAI22_03g350750 [Oryza sativa Japonica Group]